MSNLSKLKVTFSNINVPLTAEIVFIVGLLTIIIILSIRIDKINNQIAHLVKKQNDNDKMINDLTSAPLEYQCPACPKGWNMSGGVYPNCNKSSKHKFVSGQNDVLDCAPGKHSRSEAWKCVYNPPSQQRTKQIGKPC